MEFHVVITVANPDYRRPWVSSQYKSFKTEQELLDEVKLYVEGWLKDEDMDQDRFRDLDSFYANNPIDGVYFGPDGYHSLTEYIDKILSSSIRDKENNYIEEEDEDDEEDEQSTTYQSEWIE